jgi:hypothetical protein
MHEADLRDVLLVKAIEEVDRAGTLLPPGDRAQATREALREVAGVAAPVPVAAADDSAAARVLAARAKRLVDPLLERHPILAEVRGAARVPGWLLAGLLLAAFASGIGLSALDGARRINLLAFPFLGLVAWNLATYVALAVLFLRRLRGVADPASRSGRWALAAVGRRIAPLARQSARVHAELGEAIGGYAAGWAAAGAPLLAHHAQRALHLAAALLALGLIAGLYVRGTVLRYEAGWESTFLGPAQVRAVFGVVFGPAAALAGMALPATREALESLRFTATGGGGDAAPWIHLIALSAALYVLVPRLLLAGATTVSLGWLARPGRLPEVLRPYASAVLAGGGLARGDGRVSVTPYAHEPSEAALAGLARWLESQAGTAVRLERRTTLRYGEEDMAATAFDLDAHRAADLHVVLMTLAATPEAENHGVVIAAARDAARRARPPAVVRVVVDETPYATRLAGDASLAPRLEERRQLWRQFVRSYGLDAEFIGDILLFPSFSAAPGESREK